MTTGPLASTRAACRASSRDRTALSMGVGSPSTSSHANWLAAHCGVASAEPSLGGRAPRAHAGRPARRATGSPRRFRRVWVWFTVSPLATPRVGSPSRCFAWGAIESLPVLAALCTAPVPIGGVGGPIRPTPVDRGDSLVRGCRPGRGDDGTEPLNPLCGDEARGREPASGGSNRCAGGSSLATHRPFVVVLGDVDAPFSQVTCSASLDRYRGCFCGRCGRQPEPTLAIALSEDWPRARTIGYDHATGRLGCLASGRRDPATDTS
jgi:hypothetical protein